MTLELRSPLAGWCIPLDDVPDDVFSSGMIGPGVAIDPTGDRLYAPCDGVVLSVHAAGHAVTLRATDGVVLLLHLGIDTVALGGDGFEPLVAPGAAIRTGDALVRFDLDRLVRSGHPVVSPIIVTNDALSVTPVAMGGLVAVGDLLMRVSGLVEVTADGVRNPGESRTMVVDLAYGLHARPAARIVSALRGLDARVRLSADGRSVSAASSVAILGLSLGHGARLTAEAEGADATVALDRIAALLKAEADPAESPRTRVRPVAEVDADLAEGALVGVGASPGLAVGPAWRLRRRRPTLPSTGDGVQAERSRLDAALAKVGAALQAEGRTGGPAAGIAAAHRELLDDPILREGTEAGIREGLHAASAFHRAATAEAVRLRGSADRRIAERADDLDDIGTRVALAALGQVEPSPVFPPGGVLIADDLLPSHLMDPGAAALAGVVLSGGGATSHVAILAAGLGVPMVVALGPSAGSIVDGTVLIVDGDAGLVVTDPSIAVLDEAQVRIDRQLAAEDAARTSGERATRTLDGTAIAVMANLGSLADAQAAVREGAEGSGLLRTEFLFLDQPSAPDTDEQARCFQSIAEALDGRPLTLRLLDVGGDKSAPYLAIAAEDNPALGERGVRVLLNRPSLLDAQLRAILRVRPLTTIRIMVPMIASLDEFAAIRRALDRVAAEESVVPPPLGVMVETPAAALIADRLAETADFLSIGSNDLTQYTLAMDRGNPTVATAADGLHPAVLRLIDLTCRGSERHGRSVGLCGGLAADPLAVPILIGLGIRSLSVPPKRVPGIRAIVGGLTLDAARTLAVEALGCDGAGEVRSLTRQFLGTGQ